MPLPVRIQVALIAIILTEMNIGIGTDPGIHKLQLIAINFLGKGSIGKEEKKIKQTALQRSKENLLTVKTLHKLRQHQRAFRNMIPLNFEQIINV